MDLSTAGLLVLCSDGFWNYVTVAVARLASPA
jgi:serine/threonine protein phosphatase PrpC